MRKEAGSLDGVTDLPPQLWQPVVVDRLAVNVDRAGARSHQAVDELQERRLAAAAGSDDRRGDAVHKRDGHSVQGCFLAVGFAHFLEKDVSRHA